MFKFDDPLATALTLVDDLPNRVVQTMKKGDLQTTAELYSDLTFLKACIEQLAKPNLKGTS
jgi:hypothetical protein